MSNPLLRLADEFENIAIMVSKYPSMQHRQVEYSNTARVLRTAAAVIEWARANPERIPAALDDLIGDHEAACKEQP